MLRQTEAQWGLSPQLLLGMGSVCVVPNDAADIFEMSLGGTGLLREGSGNGVRVFVDASLRVLVRVLQQLGWGVMVFLKGLWAFYKTLPALQSGVLLALLAKVIFNPPWDERGPFPGLFSDDDDNSKSLLRDMRPQDRNYPKFKDVIGHDDVKERMKQVLDFMKNPERWEGTGVRPPRGILLEGPPGVGKTFLAKALANECDAHFEVISCGGIGGIYVGMTARKLKKAFNRASKHKKAIVFMDEFDAVGLSRRGIQLGDGGAEQDRRMTIGCLLEEMDGFENSPWKKKGDSITLYVAATNDASRLDDALLRPGRFDIKYALQLPGPKMRMQILNRYLQSKEKKNLKLSAEAEEYLRSSDFVGAETPMSPAQLEVIANEAKLSCLKRNGKEISCEDLDEALDFSLAGGRELADGKPGEFAKTRQRDCVYLAGKAIMASLLGSPRVAQITAFPRTGIDGIANQVLFEEAKKQTQRDRDASLAGKKREMATLYGGKAAEEVFYGTEDVSLRRISADMKKARALAQDIEWAMGRDQNSVGPLECEQRVKKLLKEADQAAYDLLFVNQELLCQVANTLLEKGRMTGVALRQQIHIYQIQQVVEPKKDDH